MSSQKVSLAIVIQLHPGFDKDGLRLLRGVCQMASWNRQKNVGVAPRRDRQRRWQLLSYAAVKVVAGYL